MICVPAGVHSINHFKDIGKHGGITIYFSFPNRRANLRSWREFAMVHRLGAPASLKQAQMRMRYNLYYYSSNYLLIMAGLFGFTMYVPI
jgi:hypothetical protein